MLQRSTAVNNNMRQRSNFVSSNFLCLINGETFPFCKKKRLFSLKFQLW